MLMFIVSQIAASCAVVLGALLGARGPACAAIVAISAAIVVAAI